MGSDWHSIQKVESYFCAVIFEAESSVRGTENIRKIKLHWSLQMFMLWNADHIDFINPCDYASLIFQYRIYWHSAGSTLPEMFKNGH
jgi:hypothetical protein